MENLQGRIEGGGIRQASPNGGVSLKVAWPAGETILAEHPILVQDGNTLAVTDPGYTATVAGRKISRFHPLQVGQQQWPKRWHR
jgi:hypothetical protein